MSRIGKKPIQIPESVEIKIEGNTVTTKGPKGEIVRKFCPEVKIELKDNQIFVSLREGKNRGKELQRVKSFWGLTRALLFNMIKGVTEGFEKKLEIEGIGFRAVAEGDNLILYLGFSHPVKAKIPQGINVAIEKNVITVSGISKEAVGQFAAIIRKTKPPEPYKGKGIKYAGETIRRKIGKKAVTTGEK